MSSDPKNSELLQIDVFEVLRRRYPLILIGSVIGLAVAAIYCFTATTRFESDGVVMVMPKDARITSSSGAGGTDLGMQANVGEELLATHMQILTSPKVIKAALASVDDSAEALIDRPSLVDQLPSAEPDSAMLRKNAVHYIKKNLSVSRGGEGASKDAQVLRVRLEHTDPDDCQAFLTSIIDSYQAFLRSTADDAGNDARTLFAQASDDLEQKLAEQDAGYREFLENAPMLWNSDGATMNPHQMRVTEIEKELGDIRLRRTELRSRVNITQGILDDDDLDPRHKITVFDPADVQRLGLLIQLDSESFDREQTERSQANSVQYGEFLRLLQEKARLEKTVGSKHPLMLQIEQEITKVQQVLREGGGTAPGALAADQAVDINRLVTLYHGLLKNDLLHAESRESALTQLLEEENQQAKQMVTYELEESRLKRDLERTETLYNTVIERLREVDLAKVYGAFTTETISPPEVGLKSWPKIPLLGALGLMLGTLGGIAFAVGTELSARSFRGHEDIEQELDTSVLTHIPVMTPRDLRAVKPDSKLASQLVAHHQPKSHHAEAIRNLRASVYFRTSKTQNPVIQITSPNPGDGKSTMTANLAVSIAQTNKRVLLLECDMRRPSQHKLFGFDRDKAGLAQILSGDCSINDATVACAEVPNLSLISSGGIPDNPAELLALPEFNQFLSVIRDDYDFVLVDSPPIGPVSDSAIIASLVNQVILGLTLSKNARAAASAAQESLVGHGAKLMGLVVSKYGGTNSYGYSSYGYGGGYYGKKYEQSSYYTYS